MPFVALQVIEPPPEGSTATVLVQQDASVPVVTGHGEIPNALDYVCGKCGNLLAEYVRENQYRSIVFFCKKCSSYNRVS
jgi:DNA-directed RNA polymerase subunit RPC12/RpoP